MSFRESVEAPILDALMGMYGDVRDDPAFPFIPIELILAKWSKEAGNSILRLVAEWGNEDCKEHNWHTLVPRRLCTKCCEGLLRKEEP